MSSQSVLKGLVIPPRRTSDILLSAGQSCFSFLSKESRDKFVDMANKGIINANLLGIPLSLALFNGLNCPLFDKYDFDVVEFGKGAKDALQHYHNIQFSLQDEISKSVQLLTIPDSPQEIVELAEKRSAELKEKAENEPNSFAGQMKRMVTPAYFEEMCSTMNRDTLLLKEINVNYSGWSSEVTNVSSGAVVALIVQILLRLDTHRHIATFHSRYHQLNLLSARAVDVPPQPATPDELPHLTKEEVERNDDLINNIYMEHPCIAQLEVIYDIKTSVNMTGPTDDNNDRIAEPVNSSTSVVGVFEGWLHGSPTGSLEWKLGLNRPFFGI